MLRREGFDGRVIQAMVCKPQLLRNEGKLKENKNKKPTGTMLECCKETLMKCPATYRYLAIGGSAKPRLYFLALLNSCYIFFSTSWCVEVCL